MKSICNSLDRIADTRTSNARVVTQENISIRHTGNDIYNCSFAQVLNCLVDRYGDIYFLGIKVFGKRLMANLGNEFFYLLDS